MRPGLIRADAGSREFGAGRRVPVVGAWAMAILERADATVVAAGLGPRA